MKLPPMVLIKLIFLMFSNTHFVPPKSDVTRMVFRIVLINFNTVNIATTINPRISVFF